MAFSNTPSGDTYRTVQVKLDNTPTLRSISNSVRRDSHVINFFYERISQENKEREVSLVKRPGIQATSISLNKGVSTDNIRGYFYEEQEGIFFWAVGNMVYKYIPSPLGSYSSTVATLSTSSGEVCFDTFQKSTGEVYILISDGAGMVYQKLRTYPEPAATAITTVPSPHQPRFTVLNGYVFVAQGYDIHNCANDDFNTWNSTDFISCEMSADGIQGLYRNKNYIVALGYNSMETFWDAANTNSPLSRNDSAFKSIGFNSGYAQVGDISFFVGQEQNKGLVVYKMDGFKVEPVSNAVVEKSISSPHDTDYSSARVNYAKGHILTIAGHTFYMLCGNDITWVYDIEEKFWYEWRSPTGTMLVEAAWAMFNGGQYIALNNGTTIDFISPLVYNDKGTNFTASYTSEDNMFGSVNWKTCNRLSVVSDRHQATGTSTLTVQWSDNDWTDNPTGSTTVNVFSNIGRNHRLGRFRNRSFRLLYTDNYPIRIKSLELEINIGSH